MYYANASISTRVHKGTGLLAVKLIEKNSLLYIILAG
jgi:hypothetical protein